MPEKPIESMSKEEVVDALARIRGWTLAEKLAFQWTLDSVAKQMPEGVTEFYVQTCFLGSWGAHAKHPKQPSTVSSLHGYGDTEILARARLALSVLRTTQGSK